MYLPGVTATGGYQITTVTTTFIPFSTIAVQAPGSAISLNTATGVITVASTGFYQITFGLREIAANANLTSAFTLLVNGVSASNQILEFKTPGSGRPMFSLTTIVQITTNPSTVAVINTTVAATTNRNINNASLSATSGGPAAYINIIGMQ
jgi:hypothetical protein